MFLTCVFGLALVWLSDLIHHRDRPVAAGVEFKNMEVKS